MPSLSAYERLKGEGLDLDYGDALRFNMNDTVANEADLSALFETLQKFRDANNNPAVFTALSLVANPDFEKIKAGNFQQYFYEPFTQTLKRYYGSDNIFQLWNEGIRNKLFVPQFHGREHLNIAIWMKDLRERDHETLLAFDEGFWGFKNKNGITYQAAFDLDDPSELKTQHKVIEDGLELFEMLFGYRACLFVPPNGPINNALEETAAQFGIKFMSAAKIQNEVLGNGRTRKRFHYLGQKNRSGQIYLTRNCFFEPGQKGRDWVQSCLNEIEIAFRWGKPAIISSHRVNYIGALSENNGKIGRKRLENLLRIIINKWADVEFLTSVELGEIIIEMPKKD